MIFIWGNNANNIDLRQISKKCLLETVNRKVKLVFPGYCTFGTFLIENQTCLVGG